MRIGIGAPVPEVGNFRRPENLPDLLTLLSRHSASALAGGTDLVLMRADGVVDPALDIIDIKAIPELQGISRDEQGNLEIGAATSLRELVSSPLVRHHAISDGAALVGGWQTRVRGTIGGNICRASPAGDTLPGVLVADAQLELSSADGTRLVPAHTFFIGPGRTVRQSHELLTRIVVPASAGDSAYVRFTNRLAMDLAVVGVAAHLELEDGNCVAARIALSAAAPTPVLASLAAQALIGTALDEPSIQAAAELVLEAATPIDDGRGSQVHRRTLLPVLAKRAIGLALSRAREGHPS
ncbi:MAG TPA: FAD binding domain-containing protein [Actinomycetes bacterium]|nr:FAD binding domain-containing protein [Actinomycetes bacterium]